MFCCVLIFPDGQDSYAVVLMLGFYYSLLCVCDCMCVRLHCKPVINKIPPGLKSFFCCFTPVFTHCSSQSYLLVIS